MFVEPDILRRIEAMPEPRHLFVLPDWADPRMLDSLLTQGHLRCVHAQRDASGSLILVMGLTVTESGRRVLHSPLDWRRLAVGVSLGGATLAALSLGILYWG